MTRLVFAVAAAAALAGCKEPQPSVPQAGFVSAGRGIAIKDVRVYLPGDAVAGTSDRYYIVTFAFTNDLGLALAPRIDRFVLEDDQKRRFLGADSGNANLVGISNYAGVLQTGESHEYTVGFRVPQNTHGSLFYDASF